MSPSQTPRATGTTAPDPRRSRRADHARRVADVLRAEVVSGRVALGMLPPESHLAGEFGVSRNAVRAALDLLRSEGLVERIPGTGSRTRDSILPQGIDHLLGLAETFGGRGDVRNEVLLSTTVPAPRAVAERLELRPATTVVCLERRRFIGGRPLSLDLTFLAPEVGLPLLDQDLSSQDLFVLIEEVSGHTLGTADLVVGAALADATRSTLLDVRPGAPLLVLERLTRLDDGRPVDLEFIRMRGDRICLQGTAVRPSSAPRQESR